VSHSENAYYGTQLLESLSDVFVESNMTFLSLEPLGTQQRIFHIHPRPLHPTIRNVQPTDRDDTRIKKTLTMTYVKSMDIQLLTFPAKLHMILSSPEYQRFMGWCSHGRAWKIHKPKELEMHIIPRFFRSAKYTSFMRQVRRPGRTWMKRCCLVDTASSYNDFSIEIVCDR